MIDPRISLLGVVPQTQSGATTANIFQSNLNNAQNRSIAQQQAEQQAALAPFFQQQQQQAVDINSQAIAREDEAQKMSNKHKVGQLVKSRITGGDLPGAIKFLQDASTNATAQGVTDTREIDSWISE